MNIFEKLGLTFIVIGPLLLSFGVMFKNATLFLIGAIVFLIPALGLGAYLLFGTIKIIWTQ